MTKYEQNAYNYFKRQGLADKYEHAGIYCIKIDKEIVYIGKSVNMLRRVAEHYVGIKTGSNKKYRIIAEAQRKGHNIDFDVLYYAKSKSYELKKKEIGNKESEYIREYQPILNTQIPKIDDYNKFEYKEVNAKEILPTII